jgi:hypothetical protein
LTELVPTLKSFEVAERGGWTTPRCKNRRLIVREVR